MLLFILKVLGIILLCVIGLLLLVACIVLFVPVRYKYRFRYDDNNKSINCNYIDLHWIMYIIRCRILISLSSIKYETRLFGIRTKWLDRLIFKTDLNDESIDEDSNDAKELLDDIEEIWEDLSEEYSESNSDNVKQETDKVRTSTKKSSWKVLNPINWCKIILDKIVSIVKFICRVIKSSIKSIELLVKRIDLVLDFLDKNSTIKGIERVKKYISMVCRHVLPRKKKIDLTIGFDDPAHTGSVLDFI